jgi:CRISPR system Cascade subunit CasA
MNLLTKPAIRTEPLGLLTLPGVLAALARGEVAGFPALRPHQRAAWHMFLVQLGVLALDRAGLMEPPGEEGAWAGRLRGLTPDWGDDPWTLVVPDRSRPAFLQPPDPGGLNWSPVPTPDALDMLITSKNHDLKGRVAQGAQAEDWVFALVSLQTMEGYGGAGNHGIARMNGGSSSRPSLGLAPVSAARGGVDPGARWRRDVTRLLALRAGGEAGGMGLLGGPALLWCLPWPEGRQLALHELDPLFIEVCRRVRLLPDGTAERTTSAAARIDAKAAKGATGDPWAPVHRTEGKALTLGERDWDFRLLGDLLFGHAEKGGLVFDWEVPALARPGSGEDPSAMVLVAEALSRGNNKTGGLKSRIVPLPRRRGLPILGATVAEVAAELMRDVEAAQSALRFAVAVFAAGGDGEKPGKDDYARAGAAQDAFLAAVDTLFFPALWARLEAMQDGRGEEEAAVFRKGLVDLARIELGLALDALPVPSILAPRARVRARGALEAALRRAKLTQPKPEGALGPDR